MPTPSAVANGAPIAHEQRSNNAPTGMIASASTASFAAQKA
jgi:hypothetical protein